MIAANLVLQSFGRENEYKRAIFTILSYYAYTAASLGNTRTILFTDMPSYFETHLEGLPIEYVTLTPSKINIMRGDIDFLHRMKIALIEEAFTLTNEPLLYADSDTFFINDPTGVLEEISERKAYMHLMEYSFEKEVEDKTATYKNFYELIKRQDFMLSDGSTLRVTSQHCSWNAGVMVFHPSHARFIPDVYFLTDQFYPGSGSHASEQFAFSLVLQKNVELQPCDHIAYHYWYRVKKQIVDDFLARELTAKWALQPLQQKLATVKSWTLTMPSLFKKHIWMIRDHAIQAFNQNKFYEGYRWAAKALLQKPFGSSIFLKDSFYHLKRHLTHK